MLLHHFVDPDLRAETFFEKERPKEKRGIGFETRGIEVLCRACLRYCFLGYKKEHLLKVLLTCTFNP